MSQIFVGENRTLSAFFDSEGEAQRAVDRLIEAGVQREDVQLLPGYESDTPVADPSERRLGIFGALENFLFPDEDRHVYAEGLSRGGFLVVVTNLSAALHERALDILDDEGSIDLDEREEFWREEGWTRPDDAERSLGATRRRDADIGRRRVRSYADDQTRKTDVEIEDQRRPEAERLNRG